MNYDTMYFHLPNFFLIWKLFFFFFIFHPFFSLHCKCVFTMYIWDISLKIHKAFLPLNPPHIILHLFTKRNSVALAYKTFSCVIFVTKTHHLILKNIVKMFSLFQNKGTMLNEMFQWKHQFLSDFWITKLK